MNFWHIYSFYFPLIYSYNKNCAIPIFINLISDRANFVVSGPTPFDWMDHRIRRHYCCQWEHGRIYLFNWGRMLIVLFICVVRTGTQVLYGDFFRWCNELVLLSFWQLWSRIGRRRGLTRPKSRVSDCRSSPPPGTQSSSVRHPLPPKKDQQKPKQTKHTISPHNTQTLNDNQNIVCCSLFIIDKIDHI